MTALDTLAPGSTAYALGSTEREYERLRKQAQVWEHATERVLDRVDPAPGSRCLDAGCGPGVTMRQLARRVGPEGQVVGVDVDAVIGRLSVERLHAAGHRQCEFHEHDLRGDDPIPGAPFDVVYARLLLFHLADRPAVLARLWDAVAPGGHLVVQDYDLSAVGAVPALASVDAVGELILAAFGAAGCEIRAGAWLPRWFAEAGVGTADGTDVAGRLDRLGDAASMLEAVLRSLTPVAVGHGLASESDVNARLDRLRESAAEDPERPLLWPLLLGAWKRKPA